LEKWQPALPAVIGLNPPARYDRLPAVQNWVPQAQGKPFPPVGQGAVRVTRFQAGKEVEGMAPAAPDDPSPIIVRMPYGLGSVTLLAVGLTEPPFSTWNGRVDFWVGLVERLGPRVRPQDADNNPPGFGSRDDGSNDLAAQLHRELDKFDVTVIS